MPEKTDGEYITRREAAEMAGVHINTVRLWESTKRVETKKEENGVVLIPRSQIESIVESRKDFMLDNREKIAALEAELKVTKSEMEQLRAQYRKLLDRMLDERAREHVS
jgi:DNA-binding transcriptional MerR regulator